MGLVVVQMRLLGEVPATVAIRGHALGLFGVIQVEKGGVDDFVLVDKRCAGEGLASEPVVGAVAD